MTIAESIVQAVNALPPEKQHEALALIQRLAPARRQLKTPEGIASHVTFDMPLEEFQALRREMWGTSSDRELEWPR